MFQASQRQLLQLTPNLRLKLHQPLPLDARQSQKLLNLLTTSFRKHLDQEHGQSELKTEDDATEPQGLESSIISNHDPSASKHMKRLMASPYFQPPDTGMIQLELGNPMAVFDAAVARGMMDITNAKNCLLATKNRIIQSSALNVQDGMRDSKAGTMVLKWLISSGHANSLDFRRNENFFVILMQFLIAEGLQEVCWTWIHKSFRDVPRLFPLPRSTERNHLKWDIMAPFHIFLKAVSVKPASLDAAYTALIKAAGVFQDLSNSQAHEVLGPSICRIISLSTSWQTNTLSTSWQNNRPPPSESIYDAFLQLLPISRAHYEFDLARLLVRHPTRPTAGYALELLKDVHRHGPPITKRPPVTDNPEKPFLDVRVRIMHLGLDTAKFLLSRTQYTEAQEVMDCLRLHFPRELGFKPINMERFKDEEAEAASLEMLDQLSVA